MAHFLPRIEIHPMDAGSGDETGNVTALDC